VPADKLWGAQTQLSLDHFSIGKDLIPRETITSYAILKKAAARANHKSRPLDDEQYRLIVSFVGRSDVSVVRDFIGPIFPNQM
jgi:fumarate hydratase class II